ncbi:MAG: transglutaminase-like domain-containing protein [Cyanobacteria bacterium P01_A01_bin.17]
MKRHVASLCSLALILWGVQTGLLLCAIPMILLLESRHIIQQRWDVPVQDLKRLAQLCGLIFALFLVFLFITQPSFSLIYRLLQWLPICVFPFVAAQTYATHFSASFRSLFTRFYAPRAKLRQKPINLYYPYFALCLVAASATNWNGPIFYGVTAVLIAILLWSRRPQRSTSILWLCLIVLASSMGFVGHLQLHQLQAKLEQQTAPWLNSLTGESVDPYQSITQMGSIGSLKKSSAVVFRVAGDRNSFPLLLREATYNKYGAGSWVALQSEFERIRTSAKGIWKLSNTAPLSDSITVTARLGSGKGILRLPDGTAEISQLQVKQLEQNQYGTTKVTGKSGRLRYQMQFNPAWSEDAAPTDADLQIPKAEQAAVEQTLQTLNTAGKSETEVVDQLSAFFQRDFQYSLEFSQSQNSKTPLSAFLLDHRSGHCEYFASATTLLLRGAGIPARYAVGYSVHEFSPLEQQYVVRSRNAHAWSMAYINGSWQSVDTTPPDWTAQEDAAVSPLQVLSDLWSFSLFQLSNGLQQLTQGKIWIGVAIASFILFLFWKWVRKLLGLRSQRPEVQASAPAAPSVRVGIDSEFYQVEQRLNELNLQRTPSESLQQWIKRLQVHLTAQQLETLRQIKKLHYRYRFDPQGIEPTDRETLRSLSYLLLEQLKREFAGQQDPSIKNSL